MNFLRRPRSHPGLEVPRHEVGQVEETDQVARMKALEEEHKMLKDKVHNEASVQWAPPRRQDLNWASRKSTEEPREVDSRQNSQFCHWGDECTHDFKNPQRK